MGIDLAEVIVAAGFAKSKSEARRLIMNRAISLDDIKINDPFARLFKYKDPNTDWIVLECEKQVREEDL